MGLWQNGVIVFLVKDSFSSVQITYSTSTKTHPDNHVSAAVLERWCQALLQHLSICYRPHAVSSLWSKHLVLDLSVYNSLSIFSLIFQPSLFSYVHFSVVLSLASLRYGFSLASLRYGFSLASLKYGFSMASLRYVLSLASLRHGFSLASLRYGFFCQTLPRRPAFQSLFTAADETGVSWLLFHEAASYGHVRLLSQTRDSDVFIHLHSCALCLALVSAG